MSAPIARRTAGLSLLAAPLGALAFAAGPAAAASGNVAGVCTAGSQRIISQAGSAATCAKGVPLMNAWRTGGKPKRFRSYVCGEVKKTKVAFHDDKRWFATWQCAQGSRATYTIWTRY